MAALFLLLSAPVSAFAGTAGQKSPLGGVKNVDQVSSVTGTVLDENGEAVIGANILVKETRKGAVSDVDGRFSVPADGSVTLIISYMGYETKTVKAQAGRDLQVRLTSDSKALEEVIVTGYGTFKKSAYAGSASTIKTSELKDVPTVSFSGLLQGAAPGIQISSGSGQPGAATSINIRGMGSFNASNSPLYVVDGVPVMSGNMSVLDTDAGLDIMTTLNTADIENITIIKDAAAASLYGSRAANGVILITTKKGKVGKPQVSLKADWGYSDFAMDYRPVMNGEQRREFLYTALKNDALDEGSSEEEAIAYADENIDDYAPVPYCGYVDWNDILFKKGNHQNYEASISGGSDSYKFYASLNYLKQEGITLSSGLERISGRVNTEFKATKQLTVGYNSQFSHVNQDVYSEGTTYTSPFYSSRSKLTPSDPVYNEDGSWNRDFIGNDDYNPLLSLTYDSKREYITRYMNTIFGEYEFIPNLKFKTTLSYDRINTKGKQWNDSRTSNGDATNGYSYKGMYERSKLVWANQLTYAVTIAKNHNLDALIGYETDDQRRESLSGERSNFASNNKHELSNGAKLEDTGGSSTRTRMVSYLGRVNYDYKHKYYLGGSLRTDGSSRFVAANRWGTFWSLSGAWRIIEEDFMKPTQSWLSDLKLRASYGVNGTLPSDYFGYMGLTSLSSAYNGDPAYTLSQIKNEDLSWEKNHNFNIGLDFGLWNNRITATLEFYTRTTKDLLMDYPISMTTGFSSYLLNIGKVRNQGVEFQITSQNFNSKDFSWTTTFNIATNKNKILTLDGKQTEIVSGSQIHMVGKSYRTFYLIEFAGIDPETGEPQFYTNDVDENGNYIKEKTFDPTECNRIPMKHAEPNVTGGLVNSLRYKWFDLNFTISYQFGGYSYDTWAQKTEHGGTEPELSIPSYYINAWKQAGDITNYERPSTERDYTMKSYATSRRLHSTDFIRLKNLTFGFTFPKEWTRTIGIDNVRLYLSGNNLLTWAKYDYYDPEAVSAGTAGWGTPPLKTLTFGLNINF